MRVVFCREDPVIELFAKRNVKLEDQIYWFRRDLTQSERKLEFKARKKQRERQCVWCTRYWVQYKQYFS